MSTLINSKELETTYLRTKSRFYVAGWTANNMSENPQELPESCKNDPVIVKQHDDYLSGYGDCYANNESGAIRHNENLDFIDKMNEVTDGAFV